MLAIRPTTPADVAYVVALEHHPENAANVTQWSAAEHLATIADPAARHLILARPGDGAAVGFMILADLDDPAGVRQLLRIVVGEKGHGYGRAALRYAKRVAFAELAATKLWLDVKTHNTRARALYEAEGFVLVGPSPTDPSFLILEIDRPD